MAQHEREGVDLMLGSLLKKLGRGYERDRRVADALTLFTDVAKLFADIHLARDVSNRIGDTSNRSTGGDLNPFEN